MVIPLIKGTIFIARRGRGVAEGPVTSARSCRRWRPSKAWRRRSASSSGERSTHLYLVMGHKFDRLSHHALLQWLLVKTDTTSTLPDIWLAAALFTVAYFQEWCRMITLTTISATSTGSTWHILRNLLDFSETSRAHGHPGEVFLTDDHSYCNDTVTVWLRYERDHDYDEQCLRSGNG